MKKKSLLAMLLAFSMFAGGASLTGCNLADNGGNGGNTDQTETIHVTGVSLSSKTLEIEVNGTHQLVATVAPSAATNKACTWSSSDPDTVSVSTSGKITGKKVGVATITVTTKDGNKTDTCEVTVRSAKVEEDVVKVTGVTVTPTTLKLIEGESGSLTAKVTPSDATNKEISWVSSAPDIATVDEDGKVTAVKAGKATITVTTADGGKTATCSVTVSTPPPEVVNVTGVTVDPTSLTLTEGETGNITATVSPADATNKNVSWSSNAPGIATVDKDGKVTAVKAGSATITVTTEDGNKTATCSVTVNAEQTVEPKKQYTVTFYSEGIVVHTETVTEGETVQSYTDIEKEGHVLKGWTTNSNGQGEQYNFNTPVTGALDLYAIWQEVSNEFTYTYSGYECAAFEWKESDVSSAKVEYKLKGASSYTTVDKALVRASATSGVARVDIVGLKGNSNYDFKVTTSDGEIYQVSDMFIAAYDRSGYAHFKKSDGVGAYKDDGTPKDNAKIYYVTEANKNNVDGKGNSVVQLLMNQKGGSPMIIRIIGTVGAATWKKLDYNADGVYHSKNKIPSNLIKGVNDKLLSECTATDNKYYSQEDLIKEGFNELNYKPDDPFYKGGRCEELKGLTSRANIDGDGYDSCWNDASISNAANVTVEGIGEDARIFQWGFTFRNSNSIEVRNLTFEDYTEDACSFEGGSDSDTDSSSANGFKYKNFWVHHNTFEEGMNYWDICAEQDKHDGDGSTDVKRIAYVTFAYNVYHETHKTGLVGSDNKVLTSSVTFHHNLYNGCKARLPLARQANMHIYNNYYKGTTDTDLSLRASAYALVENCYFEKPESGSGSTNFDFPSDNTYGYGYAKVIGCTFADANGETVDAATSYGGSKSTPVPTTNLKLNVSRTTAMDSQNKYGANFDTDSSVFYYANGKSNVESMLTADEVKAKLIDLAGVQKRGKSVGGNGSTGGEEENPPVTDSGNLLDDLTDSIPKGATFIDNDSLSIVLNGGTVDIISLNATSSDGKNFSKVLLPGGSGRTYVITAKKDISLSIYYTVRNSSGVQKDVVTATKEGGTVIYTSDDGTREDGVAYIMTFTVKAGDVVTLSSVGNRLSLFGIYIA